jgi:hypothetical protein
VLFFDFVAVGLMVNHLISKEKKRKKKDEHF